jgi:hypothetical protein
MNPRFVFVTSLAIIVLSQVRVFKEYKFLMGRKVVWGQFMFQKKMLRVQKEECFKTRGKTGRSRFSININLYVFLISPMQTT